MNNRFFAGLNKRCIRNTEIVKGEIKEEEEEEDPNKLSEEDKLLRKELVKSDGTVDFTKLISSEKRSIGILKEMIGYQPGAIAYYARKTAPPGWLLCDGRKISQTDYPQLFEAIGHSYIKNPDDTKTYDKEKNFNLPDFQNAYLRSFDDRKKNRLDVERTSDWTNYNNHKLQNKSYKDHSHSGSSTNDNNNEINFKKYKLLVCIKYY